MYLCLVTYRNLNWSSNSGGMPVIPVWGRLRCGGSSKYDYVSTLPLPHRKNCNREGKWLWLVLKLSGINLVMGTVWTSGTKAPSPESFTGNLDKSLTRLGTIARTEGQEAGPRGLRGRVCSPQGTREASSKAAQEICWLFLGRASGDKNLGVTLKHSEQAIPLTSHEKSLSKLETGKWGQFRR